MKLRTPIGYISVAHEHYIEQSTVEHAIVFEDAFHLRRFMLEHWNRLPIGLEVVS